MDVFYFVAIFFLIRRLQKAYRNTPVYTKWSSRMFIAMYASIVVFLIVEIVSNSLTSEFIGGSVLFYILLFIHKI